MVIAAVLFVDATVGMGCNTFCPQPDCLNSVSADREVTATAAELSGAKVEMCGVSGCVTITLPTNASDDGSFAGSNHTETSEKSTATFRPGKSGTFDAFLWFSVEGVPSRDGEDETVTMTVTSGDGAKVLLQIRETAVYERDESCSGAPDCFHSKI